MFEKILDKTCLQKNEQIKKFKQRLVREIVQACIEEAIMCYNIKMQQNIEFHKGYIDVTIMGIKENVDTRITKTRNRTFRDLGHLIVHKEEFIEFIKESFIKE